jgi:hypothetical protein
MKRILSAVLALVVPASLLAAPVPEPPGPAPEITIVRKEGGNLIREVIVYKAVPVTREIAVVVDGKTVKRTVTEAQLVPVTELQAVPLKDVRAWTGDGKPLDADALARRLEKQTPVLISRDGRPLSAAYRALVRDDAIILALPQTEGPKVPELRPLPPRDR